MRSLESLYWYGVKLLSGEQTFFIEKLSPYNQIESFTVEQSLKAIIDYMNENKLSQLVGETEIFIFPSYEFKICKGIITNFHQPDSTLILLVAALVGENWKKIYDYALENNFRFLSYGDSSLLIP
jgi:S-adenosylmethionine:tRNA ribosyltransferase-isomerase